MHAPAAMRNGCVLRFDGHEPDDQIHRDPAKRAHDSDWRKVASGIGHLLHRNRIRERDGRKVAETEGEQEREYLRKRRDAAERDHADRAERVEHRHDAFSGEEPVGDEPDKEWRYQAGDRNGAERRACFGSGEVQSARQVGIQRDVPGSPDHILQKHHRGEASLDES
jgi:hypothetical protein